MKLGVHVQNTVGDPHVAISFGTDHPLKKKLLAGNKALVGRLSKAEARKKDPDWELVAELNAASSALEHAAGWEPMPLAGSVDSAANPD